MTLGTEQEQRGRKPPGRAPVRCSDLLPVSLVLLQIVLLQAFLMAPYQHVHLHRPGSHEGKADHDHHHDDRDHDDGAAVHIHLYAFSIPDGSAPATSVEESRGGHVSVSLDSFATLPHAGMPAFVKPQSQKLLFAPEESVARIVETIEPCGHDPPSLDFSAPRAPPV